MAAKKKRTAKQVEWIGGLVRLPAYVTGEGEPYRPAAVLWLSADGLVLGMEVLGREGEPEQLVASFEATTRKPMIGRPHAPDRVRMASTALVAALRAAVAPGIEVICAPTPEIDAMMAMLQEKVAATSDDEEETHLAPGITAEAMGSFFRTAARLHRTAPWDVVPDDACLIGVTVDQLGVRDAMVSIIGQAGESYGFVCFDSFADYEAYVDAFEVMEREAMEEGRPPKLPPHIALNFDRGADIPAPLRKEISAHGWEVAGANAYPWIAPLDEDAVSRPPTAAELTRIEAIAGAIAWLVETDPDLSLAWESAKSLVHTTTVETGAGPIRVTLAVPPAAIIAEMGSPFGDEPFDVRASILDEAGELDEDFFVAYQGELLDRFAASPEAAALPNGVGHSSLLLEYAARHFGATPATLTPAELREILFDAIPAKLLCPADIAGSIVTELRAFFTFLGREFELPNAAACLAVLGEDAAPRLERALADPRNFAPAKAMLMAGRDAGFDIFTPEGLEAWMSELRNRPIAASSPKSSAESQAQKNKRKAERKARRKSR